MTALLRVSNLTVDFATEDGVVHAVSDVSFAVERGKTLAIVGESGSGKSVTVQSIMGLIASRTVTMSGEALFDGRNLIGMPADEIRKLRGRRISMIFQDPLSSLHPFYRIGEQLTEAILVHETLSAQHALDRAVQLLKRVGIPNAEARVRDYPHQLSGGMRQRVMIAMALLNSPELLIADEPTTALDVTVQAQIIDLLRDLQREFGMSIVLITHDLGVVADVADEVAVMYAGRIVEQGSVSDIYYRPHMPYTMGLLASVPRMDLARGSRLDPIPGQPPSLIMLPSGCAFHPRCQFIDMVPADACRATMPDLSASGPEHLSRCHLDPVSKDRLGSQIVGGQVDPS